MRHLFIFIFILIGSFHSAVAQEAEIKTWYIADAKIACTIGDVTTSCLRIKDSLSGEWRNFQWDIEGFQHEKGFEYVIQVRLDKLKFTEDNGPQYKYTLEKVVSKTNMLIIDKRILANNTFRIINIEQYGRTTLAVKSKAFIQFDPDTNLISGFAGCNSFAGPCSYATAFMEFGTLNNTLKTCEFQTIEDKIMQSLKGKATFYMRKGMVYVVCENFMTLHLKPERSMDSILRVFEEEKAPKRDIHFSKTEDGLYIVNAPISNGPDILLNSYRPFKLTAEEKKKIYLKLVPFQQSGDITEVLISKKAHEKPHMYYATITYKNGKKKEVEIRENIIDAD